MSFDYIVQVMRMCKTLDGGAWEVQGSAEDPYMVTRAHAEAPWHCTCPAFTYHPERECKHIKQIQEGQCPYHELTHGPANEDGSCPLCGGETVLVKVAV